MEKETKNHGQAIDEIVRALESLDEGSRMTAIRESCEHLHIQFGGIAHSVHRESSKSEAGVSAPSVMADIKSKEH